MIYRKADFKKYLNRILEDGFSHALVVIHKVDHDIMIDPRIGYTEVTLFPKGTDYSYLGRCQRVERRVPIGLLRGKFGLLNCVEQVKMFLGIRKKRILTPYQLFKYLEKENGFSIQKT